MVATAADGILALDHKGLVKLFNPAAERLFGYKASEVVEQHVRILMPDNGAEGADDWLKAPDGVEGEGVGIRRETKGRRKNGSTFPIELTIGEVPAPAPWALVGVIRDMSAEKRRARELAAVIDTAVDAIVIIGRTGIIRVFNPAAEQLFGYTADEAIGQNVNLLMPSPYQAEHDQYLKHYHATGRRKIIGIGREVQGQRKDGSTFPMELAVGEVADGEEFAFVGMVRDVTEQKDAFDALAVARARAESANLAKTQFLSRMSHELRTPMNAILGFAQLLRMSDQKAMAHAQFTDYVDSIIGPATHLTELIDEILDLSRIEAGGFRIVRETVDLVEIVSTAVNMVQPMAIRLGISIFNRCVDQSSAPKASGDRVRLRQCIVNLLTNAIKYNRAKGRVLVDVTESGAGPHFVRLVVEDTGLGVPTESIEELFQPFTRLHPGLEHVEGAGIGLAVTRQLMEAMGGSVGAESAPGRGSRFYLDIALAQGDVEQKPMPEAQSLPDWHDTLSEGDAPKVVLYVEDSPANAHLMESLFRTIPGVDLRIAYSAERGLDMAATLPIRAIILDINLPGMDGWEAFRQFRARAELANVPVIGLSARAGDADIAQAEALGFFRYLTKPVNVADLMRVLRAALYASEPGQLERRKTPRRAARADADSNRVPGSDRRRRTPEHR